jgi:uncharacterized protein (UPF0335 family)
MKTRITYLGIIFLAVLVSSCGNGSSEADITERLKMSADTRAKYEAKGNAIVQASYEALSAKLKNAVANEGIDQAIRTCNMHASPLADSLATAFDAKIKRTALRIRNRGNKPTLEEEAIMKLFKRAQDAGEELRPVVLLLDSATVNYYAPITIQPLCLNCHGEPGVSMKESTYETIIELYPKDRAIGYKLDELRGIWSIQFDAD